MSEKDVVKRENTVDTRAWKEDFDNSDPEVIAGYSFKGLGILFAAAAAFTPIAPAIFLAGLVSYAIGGIIHTNEAFWADTDASSLTHLRRGFGLIPTFRMPGTGPQVQPA